MLGTPGFWPPEQIAGELDAIGPRSDVYSLGATLYMLLTGRPPYEGDSILELALAVQRPPAPPRQHVRSIPAELEAICLCCLERDPMQRFASAGDLGAALEGWLTRGPTADAPEDPGIQFHYAWALAETGDREKAIGTLDALLKRDVRFAERGRAEELLQSLN